ncbi:MAG: Tol-Pal system beta propeller repeat protein TolB [Chromatiales bacterium]|jgi:TolB protein
MRNLLLLVVLLLIHAQSTAAPLTIEITEGAEGALPIAVVPFGWAGPGDRPPYDVGRIVAADLHRSGRFKVLDEADMLARPQSGTEVNFRDWRALGSESLVVGQVQPNGPGGYLVRFQLFDVYRGEQLTGYSIPTTQRDLRATAHRIADIVYEALTGEPGAFATRIAYVTSVRDAGGEAQVSLQVSDADGYNAQTIVSSAEPLMSPAWSPDGERIAYVSFERGRPAIYVQEVLTGRREQVSAYEGINGAPAWSPDGRRLALTLSKDGNADVYVLDLASGRLRALTRHYAIDTEPAWAPDGRSLVFTSDRGGGPQIYRVSADGGQAERLTFEGSYNARASFSPDGESLALVTRVNGDFRIGLMDLETGAIRVLTEGRLDESPSFAPNGSMIIYATKVNGTGELAAVSVDGRVRQRLAQRAGDVREPDWSPFAEQDRRE